MVLNLTKYNQSPLVSVADSTLDTTTTSITLIGNNSVNYGLALNQNFIALLQNFSSTTPPPNPQSGQIWFDSVNSSLKVFDTSRWITVNPPFDGNAGTATVTISPGVEFVVFLSNNIIVSAVSHQLITSSNLPATVNIADASYALSTRFPTGVYPGITLATDSNGYNFNGNAASSNVLVTARNISLLGAATGSVNFDGSSDVSINTTLTTVLNSAVTSGQFYTKVQVSSNGQVTDATAVNSSDIVSALGYTPPSNVIINGSVIGSSQSSGTNFNITATLSSTGINPGSYNNVTVGADGRVISGTTDQQVPVKGIIIWDDILIPTGWAACNGQSVVTSQGTIVTPNLTSNNIGPTQFIMKIV